MPHKHTRSKGANDTASFNLPPSIRANPLAVRNNPGKTANGSTTRKRDRDGYNDDDTPKAFARLMQFKSGMRRPSGLDDGERKKRKKRRVEGGTEQSLKINDGAAVELQTESNSMTPELPKILPGERLADFSARVNAALPLAGLARRSKSGKDLGPKERQTKMERRMQRMQAQWRQEEVRRKETEEEGVERAEQEEEERADLFDFRTDATVPGDNKKEKRQRSEPTSRGGVRARNKNDDDPWAELKERDMPKRLWDVAQAPPTFKALPKERFKVKNGAMVAVAEVPQVAGSLKRREDLVEARKDVIAKYRQMMGARRGQLGSQ